MNGSETRCRPSRNPMGRIQTRDAPTLLINHHRRALGAKAFAQRLNQSANLFAVRDVASEQNKSPWLRIGKKPALVGRQLGPGKTVDGPRAHGPFVSDPLIG